MPVSEHIAPVHPGETDIPKADDPRVKPWLDSLVEKGVMAADGTSLVKANLKRGICPDGWVWRIEW